MIAIEGRIGLELDVAELLRVLDETSPADAGWLTTDGR